MYTGTLIDELMAAVERAEAQTQGQASGTKQQDSYVVPALFELGPAEQALLGAA
jgi:hypothetical protein